MLSNTKYLQPCSHATYHISAHVLLSRIRSPFYLRSKCQLIFQTLNSNAILWKVFCNALWSFSMLTLKLTLQHLIITLYCDSKFSKPSFNNTWTVNFQMVKLVLEKTEEPEIKLPTSNGSLKKQKNSRKTSTSALLTMIKPLAVSVQFSSVQLLSHVWLFATPWITANCGKCLKRWEYQTIWLASWEICMQVKKQ